MKRQEYWSWIQGNFLKSPSLPADSGGVLHGYGAFETLYAREGRLFYLDLHLDRLFNAAETLQLECPWKAEEIESVMRELLDRNALTEARLRVSLHARETDYSAETLPSALMVSATPYQRGDHAFRLLPVSAADFNCPLSTHKSTSYSSYIRARRAAQQQGYDDALLLNGKGQVIECSTSNVFFWKDGCWYSPPLEKEGLRGIQHQVITSVIESQGLRLRKEGLRLEEEWEGGFVCNSLIGMQPIIQIGDQSFPTPPPEAYTELQEAVREA